MARFYIVGAAKRGQTGRFLAVFDEVGRRVRHLIYPGEVATILKQALELEAEDAVSFDDSLISYEDRHDFGIVSLRDTRLIDEITASITALFARVKKSGAPLEAYSAIDYIEESLDINPGNAAIAA
jgi:hypothetical protein